MNWTWNVRSNDGAMNGLEFARCTTAGGFGRVLIHAAPADAKIEIIDGDDTVVARADGSGIVPGLPVIFRVLQSSRTRFIRCAGNGWRCCSPGGGVARWSWPARVQGWGG